MRMNASVTTQFPGLRATADCTETLGRKHIRTASDSQPSDEVLLKEVSSGGTEALSELFKRYARIVRGVAYRVLRDTSEADDLLQDIFLLVHRLCGTFDSSKGSARFWILQMTYRRAISRRRYLTSRHFYTHLDLDQAANQLADDASKIRTHMGIRWTKRLGGKKPCKAGSPNSRKASGRLCTCFSLRDTLLRRSLPNWVKPLGMPEITITAVWKNCESRFLLANCRAKKQYDKRF